MIETVRFGIVGVGNIGSMHAKNIFDGKIKSATLTALCDIKEEKRERADAYGVPFYTDWRKMLKSGKIDAVLIAVPHALHPEIAIAAMKEGLHVLTEKPAGVSLSEVNRMNAEADRHNLVFGIMFNQRTNPLFQKARELVQSGALGKRKRLTWIITNWYRTESYYRSGSWRATWRGEGGGVLMNQAPHNLDLVRWIFGMPKSIRAVCREGLYHDIAVEDYAALYGEYDDGASMQFITTTGEFPGTNRLEIAATGGKLVIEEGKLKLWRLLQDEEEARYHAKEGMPQLPYVYEEFCQEAPESAHIGILNNFTEAIVCGTPLLADGREGAAQVALTCAAYLSAWTDTAVTFPMDEAAFDRLLNEKRKGEREKPLSEDQSDENGFSRWQVKW